ncbi:laccase [Calycina marina]|uniref:Laccase n=1 Tax=Calycina marina TaxID=1763456 RepID=A0A9P7Z8H2_9HELO|nr:laccase [Calycina marina]
MKVFLPTVFYLCMAAGLSVPSEKIQREEILPLNTTCENSATSRSCCGEQSIDTDHYDVIPDTGVTMEPILDFDGTEPGPTIMADCGDYVIVHVTNELPDNGVQVIDGLSGPMNINRSATVDYDEHLVALFLSDWSHETAFELWDCSEKFGAFLLIANGLINGTNTYDCTASIDAAYLGTGKRFEMTFISGKKYRIRLVGAQADSFLRFAIDNHNFTVMANDFVSIIPYFTDSIVVGGGQRYDIIVEANQDVSNYWIRSIVKGCNVIFNANANNIRGVVRYEGVADTTSHPQTAISANVPDSCRYVPLAFLPPHRSKTLIEDGKSVFSEAYNLKEATAVNEWVYVVIQDLSALNANHLMDVHGRDYYVLAQGAGLLLLGITKLNLVNPPRRDMATLPGNGFMVMAFYTDNLGESEIESIIVTSGVLDKSCTAWNSYTPNERYVHDDSEI